jgi:soluble cytochrome b562
MPSLTSFPLRTLRLVASFLLLAAFCAGGGRAIADTPLEISMQHMKKAYKELSLDLQQPQDSAKPDYLNLAAALKAEGLKARADVPKIADGMTADQKAAMVTAYQKSMDTFVQSVDVLSQDLQQSQWDAARKQMDLLKQEMIDGHKQFRKKE